MKETIGYVRLEWTCPNCGSRNPGPEKTCSNCGGPQPEDVRFEQAAEETLITDAEEIERAKARPDIHCAYCGARNPATAEKCSQCGADLAEGAARESGRVVGAHIAGPVAEVPCPSCGAQNPATAHECSQCGASMARPEPSRRPRVSRQAATARQGGCGIVGLAIIGGIILLGALFFILSSRTSDIVGRVESVGWTRSISIQALVPAVYETWREDIPSDGSVGTCEQRVHHSQDDPAPNAEKVCGTPYTVDTGSGFGEVVQDCTFQVYEDWCEYEVDEWRVVDVVNLEGQDFNPRWPSTQLSAGQREGEREESYQARFNADGKTYTYTTRDPSEFAQLQVGSRWVLKVNTFNSVVDIEPEN